MLMILIKYAIISKCASFRKNSVDNYLTTSKELQNELDYFTTTIRKEMKRLGLENEDEIKN